MKPGRDDERQRRRLRWTVALLVLLALVFYVSAFIQQIR